MRLLLYIIIIMLVYSKFALLLVADQFSTYGHTLISKSSMDQPCKVANPARGQLNREKQYFPVRVLRA